MHDDPALRGLDEQEAARRLAADGENALPEQAATPAWRRLLRQLQSPLLYILGFALVFDAGVWVYEGMRGVPFESLTIGAVLLLNALLGAFQEHRSEQALARLKTLAAPRAWVVRGGRLQSISSRAIVVGDVVRVEAGDRLPADGAVVRSQGLLVDEAVLTGESMPVDKVEGDEVLSGTLSVRGTAFFRVERTGEHSSMGRLATMIGGIDAGKTPLERRLDAFGVRIAQVVSALAVLLVVLGVFAEGIGRIDEIMLFAIALAVAAVPEGLPAVITLTLALGVQRMAKRKAVVRKLSAVESLGSVTVIATDKTGTLTENRMSVRHVDAVDQEQALRAMVLVNEADPATGAGDPLEIGLLHHASERGVDVGDVRARARRTGGRPFDAAWRFMRVAVEHERGTRSWWKGAPEVLLARATLSDEERARWSALAEQRAREGHRVLALAESDGDDEGAVRLLGLVSLWDPPRAEVPDAVRTATSAGIRVLMITGDHPATAQAVAHVVGIRADAVVTGAQIEATDDAGLRGLVAGADVFARVRPEHKLRIVEALQKSGEIVAMTGDGVNDAPALKRADVGVAMGLRGSDVAREVADLVLLDDNFATIVAAIEEGRSIYENILKFIRFMFSTNVALVLLVVGGAIGAWAMGMRDAGGFLLLPLTALQLLWINFVADGPPALALGLDRNPGVMEAPPRPPTGALLDRASLRFIAATGALKAAAGGALLVGLPLQGLGVAATRSAVFLFESVVQLLFAFPSRRTGRRTPANPAVLAAVVIGVGVQVAALLVPPVRDMLGLVALDGRTWLVVVGAVAATITASEVVGAVLRRLARPRAGRTNPRRATSSLVVARNP